MKHLIFFLVFGTMSFQVFSKEWSCLKQYQKETGESLLQPSDWLKQDRKQNTLTWREANTYNLTHHLSGEYETIKQRRDFYEWYMAAIQDKGHQVVWPSMAHFISKKLALVKVFPLTVFTSKDIKRYANLGSETVFEACFEELRMLWLSPEIKKNNDALVWDKQILHQEQYEWISEIYDHVDDKTLKTIKKMAAGKGFYSFVVPKEIRFKGPITNPDVRYQYALETLRPYFKNFQE